MSLISIAILLILIFETQTFVTPWQHSSRFSKMIKIAERFTSLEKMKLILLTLKFQIKITIDLLNLKVFPQL